MDETQRALERAAVLATAFEETLDERHVGATSAPGDIARALGGALPEQGLDAVSVLDELAAAADPGLVASAGPRYFGFVIGGRLPAALGADWLVSAWDQNTCLYVAGPATAEIEEVAGAWLLEALHLPAGASVGFATGATMANASCLAAARGEVLRRAGWDVEADGLIGAPRLRVLVGEEVHTTVLGGLRLVGLGAGAARRIPVDREGRMLPDALQAALAEEDGPAIVCAQAGNVNSGAVDPLEAIVEIGHAAGAWVHIDGAFGLWAAACPSLAHLTAGHAGADSWGLDAHKWLNVPYDCAVAIVADPAAHARALGTGAAYLTPGAGRDSIHLVPESSRRARGVTVWAALRSLGREGVVELIERNCALAALAAERIGAIEGAEVLNEVVLNQVVVRFTPPDGGDADPFTHAVIEAVQADGRAWLGSTVWRGGAAMRISVSNHRTTADDIEILAAAVADAVSSAGRLALR